MGSHGGSRAGGGGGVTLTSSEVVTNMESYKRYRGFEGDTRNQRDYAEGIQTKAFNGMKRIAKNETDQNRLHAIEVLGANLDEHFRKTNNASDIIENRAKFEETTLRKNVDSISSAISEAKGTRKKREAAHDSMTKIRRSWNTTYDEGDTLGSSWYVGIG